jgi:maltooligosyltrehalose synthase
MTTTVRAMIRKIRGELCAIPSADLADLVSLRIDHLDGPLQPSMLCFRLRQRLAQRLLASRQLPS